VAYVPRGPILAAGQEEILPDVLAALHRIARDHGAFHLKIEPEWADDLQVARRLRALGFAPARSVQPRSTLVLNLKRDPRELAAALNPRTRYNVGLAARRGVVVGIEHENALPDFYELLRQTSQRHHFPVRPLAYFEKLWAHLAGTGQAHLLVARHDGRPLSAALLLTMGKAVYYMYGGSSDARRSLKPSDLLQWEAIRWAHTEGFASYDLWGIPDEVGRPAERRSDEADGFDLPSRDLWGVYHFKRGFGGSVVRFVGAHDYLYSARRYWLWRVVLPRVRSFRRRVER
jgi:lipid II:glycine glycyltransferase (peptidoglycan interpeptide bridge formation enzyme)